MHTNNQLSASTLALSLRNQIVLASILLLLFSVTNVAAQSEDKELRQVLQLVEYIGVDYVVAVADGKIIDEGEYQEMVEFSAIVIDKIKQLMLTDIQITELSLSLQTAIHAKQKVIKIKEITTKLKKAISLISPELILPRTLSSNSELKEIYQSDCASCHGTAAAGDGVLAAGMQPAPTDFNDKIRANDRSIFGLYEAISEGIEGTTMTSFKNLTDKQRWSMAFYLGSIAFATDTQVKVKFTHDLTLQDFVMFSPNELSGNSTDDNGKNIELMRANPAEYFFNTQSSLALASQQLQKAKAAYLQGNLYQAKSLAVSAYLDGFELVENGLDAHDKVLRKQIETNLMDLRQQLSIENNNQQVEQSIAQSLILLEQAETLLAEASLSNITVFSASFIILLREGLEALLVVLALFTILVRSKRRDGVKYLHLGWSTALLAGFATWIIAQYFINISGASREIMEGVAALLAAIILLFVGFWMHSKSNTGNWQAYIKKNIDSKLKSGSLWGIAGLAFIAVYREVFETVLFYQALIMQTVVSQQVYLLSGFAFGLLILLILAWAMIKYSFKMPIEKFFAVTAYLLIALAFILTGKAISALQEADIIAISRFPINLEFTWFGIYATWQGIIAQTSVILISGLLIFKQWKNQWGQSI